MISCCLIPVFVSTKLNSYFPLGVLYKIEEIQQYSVNNFTKSLHPEILTQLTNSIQNSTENLKLLGKNSEQKTKETIEKEALLYKKLRELIITKEFVEQYELGLKNDWNYF